MPNAQPRLNLAVLLMDAVVHVLDSEAYPQGALSSVASRVRSPRPTAELCCDCVTSSRFRTTPIVSLFSDAGE